MQDDIIKIDSLETLLGYPCPDCHGTGNNADGWVIISQTEVRQQLPSKCSMCGGKGRVSITPSLSRPGTYLGGPLVGKEYLQCHRGVWNHIVMATFYILFGMAIGFDLFPGQVPYWLTAFVWTAFGVNLGQVGLRWRAIGEPRPVLSEGHVAYQVTIQGEDL